MDTANTWRNLQEENIERQTGQTNDSFVDEQALMQAEQDKQANAMADVLRRMSMSSTERTREISGMPSLSANDYLSPTEIAEMGYGDSQFDTRTSFDNWLRSGPDFRANTQSNLSKVVNGVGKMGITAGTTFLNSTLGLIYGFGSAAVQTYDELTEPQEPGGTITTDTDGNIIQTDRKPKNKPIKNVVDAFVNNDVSELMLKVSDWAERVLPNYRTEEEQSEKYQQEWYKHMGTANFWGDTVLKNFGFTIGAIGAGALTGAGLNAAMGRKLGGNLLKGAVASGYGDTEASALIAKANELARAGKVVEAQKVLRGIDTSTKVTEQIIANAEQAAKRLNKFGVKTGLYGAAIGAMGEGLAEGTMARKEFVEEQLSRAEQEYLKEYDDLERRMLETGAEKYVTNTLYMSDGRAFPIPELTEEGQKRLALERQELKDRYDQEVAYINKEGDRLASTTYLLNIPVLTASNIAQFGRMLGGGWKTARRNLVHGSISKGYRPISKGLTIAKDILKNMAIEGSEEMIQGAISSGAKQLATHRLSYYNDLGYDDEALHTAKTWFDQMYDGGKEFLLNKKNWQEGAVGAITGFAMSSIGSVKEASSTAQDSKAAVEAINARIHDKDFQTRWRDYIRHLKGDMLMEQAVVDDDKYAYHTANDDQLIGDIMAFARAGRLNDLTDMAARFTDMSLDEAKEAKDAQSTNGENPANDEYYENLSPAEYRDNVKKHSTEVLEKIAQYKDVRDAVTALVKPGTSQEFIDEMVFSMMHINDSEERFREVLNDVIGTIDGYFSYEPARSEQAQQLEGDWDASKQALKAALSTVGVSTSGLLNQLPITEMKENLRSVYAVVERMKAERAGKHVTKADVAKLVAEAEDKTKKLEVEKKIDDLIKLVEDRDVFFKKFLRMQDDGTSSTPSAVQQQFEEERMTQKKVDEQVDAATTQQESNLLKSYTDVRNDYLSVPSERNNRIEQYKKMSGTNKYAKEFVDARDRLNDFMGTWLPAHPEGGFAPAMGEMVHFAFQHASSLDEFKNLPDKILPTFEEFTTLMSGFSIIPATEELYKKTKQAVKKSVTGYNKYKDGIRTVGESGIDWISLMSEENQQRVKNDLLGQTIGKPTTKEKEKEKEAEDPSNLLSGTDPGQPVSGERAVIKPKKEDGTAKKPTESVVQPAKGSTQKEAPVLSTDTKDGAAVVIGEEESDTGVTDLTVDGVVTAAADAYASVEETIPSEEQSTDEKHLDFLHMSIPDVSTTTNTLVRKYLEEPDMEALRKMKIEPFYEESYKEFIDALWARDAFRYSATQLKTGDTIHFIIDPKFPTYQDEPTILMAVRRPDKTFQVLTPLSLKTKKYTGLNALREEIFSQYADYRKKSPNNIFVFDKTSTVYATRKGFIPYNFQRGQWAIQNITGFEKDATVVMIGRNGTPVTVQGKSVSIPDSMKDYPVGTLWYMAPCAEGKHVPVALGLRRYGLNAAQNASRVQNEVDSILTNIAGLAKDLTTDNIAAQNEELRKQLGQLTQVLDIHDIYFEFNDYNNIGPGLKIVTNWRKFASKKDDAEGNEEHYRIYKPDAVTAEKLINLVEEQAKHYQLSADAAHPESAQKQFAKLMESHAVVSFAQQLYPMGTDFRVAGYKEGEGFVLQGAQRANVIATKDNLSDVDSSTEAVVSDKVEVDILDDFDEAFDVASSNVSVHKQRDNVEGRQTRDIVSEITENSNLSEEAREALVAIFSEDKSTELSDELIAKLRDFGITEDEARKTSQEKLDQLTTCLL